jgi:hypothetical protein
VQTFLGCASLLVNMDSSEDFLEEILEKIFINCEMNCFSIIDHLTFFKILNQRVRA